jgi:alkylhydroperoxidase/carboxymuconolactone decarboxylase family protein YurZ
MTGSFLSVPDHPDADPALFDDDVAELGFVMNATRMWASFQPDALPALFALMDQVTAAHELSVRRKGILVAACASAFEDAYCSLAWGRKLAGVTDPETAAGVLRGDDTGLSDDERALAAWARKVARRPQGTTAADVQQLRDAGIGDGEIFAVTVFLALRVALATVNDALGAQPDAGFRTVAPSAVLDAVGFGRPIERGVSEAARTIAR